MQLIILKGRAHDGKQLSSKLFFLNCTTHTIVFVALLTTKCWKGGKKGGGGSLKKSPIVALEACVILSGDSRHIFGSARTNMVPLAFKPFHFCLCETVFFSIFLKICLILFPVASVALLRL